MKVLVTGATGMLGLSLVRALEKQDHAVLPLSREEADVTQLSSFHHPIQAIQADWIFHLAAFTKVDECETHADEAYLVNALGARNAAQAAAEANISLLTISTDYVFDGLAKTPYREYDPTGPRSVYGQTKLAGEQAVREIHPRHVIVRTSWLYGRGGSNFIDTILNKAREGEPLRVVDDQRGSPTSTHDLARALIQLAEAKQYGTYHVTNSGDCTWYELAKYAVQRAGLRAEIARTDSASLGRPAPRPAYSVLSNLLYEHVTGNRLPHWQDAVDRYLDNGGSRSAATSAADREER
jgi:dTDP-4-dehydrorhamnose reductase